MAEHVHGCLNCRPDMVPDFSKDDPRYHDRDKCGVGFIARLDGADLGYTRGVFEADEGWALLCAQGTYDADLVHDCPNCTTRGADEGWIDHHEVCIEPRFGKVEVIHDCPAIGRYP
jgi:hypothetical protein